MELTIILFSTIILLMIAEIIGFNIYLKVAGHSMTIKLAIESLVTMVIVTLVILITVIITKDYSADDIMCYTSGFVGVLIGCAMINTDH